MINEKIDIVYKNVDELREYKNNPRNNDKAVAAVAASIELAGFKVPIVIDGNGEKMRVDLARNILDDKDVIVFDEFTSVVNREVAKTSSYAISKAVRKQGKKFIAVACHRDIIEWLEPDWIYDTDEKRFFTLRESTTARGSNLKYTGLTTQLKSKYGKFLGNITI